MAGETAQGGSIWIPVLHDLQALVAPSSIAILGTSTEISGLIA